MKIKYIAICLILLCCLMGAASAAEDISADAVDDSIDDSIGLDAVSDDLSDSVTAEPAISDDSTTEEIDEDTTTVENGEDSADVDSDPSRASNTQAADWTALRNACQSGSNQVIDLTGTEYNISGDILFGNSKTIRGTANSYITGNSSGIPFVSNNVTYSISFYNVNFRNINCQMLIQLQTNGISKLIDCTFTNITTGTNHHSVVYNNKGTMNITGCTFSNCTTDYGVVSNYRLGTTTGVTLNVKDCRFENNFAHHEPGAINNCGQLNVTNSTFINNKATWWAGAIHTHTNAHTRIFDSTFADNVAGYNDPDGWNGGALFSYSDLEVYNSIFTGNNCSVLTGGGAIFGYSMGTSTYNITVDSCNFTRNANNHNGGYAGAIGVQNIGYLTVCNSNFINNVADYGQAIYAMTKDEPYCLNCTNCSCPNCPNCTNCSHNVSTGAPNATLINNTYLNHTGGGDTVVIDGQRYTFNYNFFINSTQETEYPGVGNQYDLHNYPTPSPSPSLAKSVLGSSVLGDYNYHDVIYVNVSSSNDRTTVDGQSWENAYGGNRALNLAIQYINNDGIIYVADGVYSKFLSGNGMNYTVIGMSRENTIFDAVDFNSNDGTNLNNNWYANKHPITTYINITFRNPKVILRGGKVFINCTFVGAPIMVDEEIYNIYNQHDNDWDNAGLDRGFDLYFNNCEFINYDTTGTILEAFTTSQINFNNCTFENITANSIAKHTGDFIFEDAINFKDCTFNNVNVKGIVDVATGTAFGELYSIEGCTGVESYGIVSEEGHDYVNSTQKTETVITAEDLTVEVNTDANLTVTLKDADGNALVGKDIIVLVGGESSTVTTVEDGVAVIPINYATEGVYEYTFYFAGDETTYKEVTKLVNVTVTKAPEPDNGTNGSNSTPVTPTKTATKLTAPKVTATYNVAKKLVITLKDAKGKALANKKVTVKVGSISKTLKTNSKGQVSVNVATLVPKTYTATVKFAGDSSYKASTVKPKVVVNKAKPKLAAKAKTFKVKAKVKKYTATLKNNKGKVLKKVKEDLHCKDQCKRCCNLQGQIDQKRQKHCNCQVCRKQVLQGIKQKSKNNS